MSEELWEKEIVGKLIGVKLSRESRYEFEVWFPYTKLAMSKIREGSFLAVRNFASDATNDHFSIIRISSVMPTHYALGTDVSGYPGFIEEAASNAAEDWKQVKSTEDTTRIVCKAIPTFIEIKKSGSVSPADDNKDVEITDEENIPMQGENVLLLDSATTSKVINRALEDIKDGQVFDIGTILHNTEVKIKALWEPLVQTHFGIFAYTNAGKSNLLSTCISKLVENVSKNKLKIIVYDLMGEYGTLLIDKLIENENSAIICLSRDTVPESVYDYWSTKDSGDLKKAACALKNNAILPKDLITNRDNFEKPIIELLEKGKIKILEDNRNIGERIGEKREFYINVSSTAASYDNWIELISTLPTIFANYGVSERNIKSVLDKIEGTNLDNASGNVPFTIAQKRDRLINDVSGFLQQQQDFSRVDDDFKIKIEGDFLTKLADKTKNSLYVIQGKSDSEVRKFSSLLGEHLLESRRKSGDVFPLICSVYDEADMFVPQNTSLLESSERSRHTAEQLARRGRKFGLGIGIATQRIVYLDTNVLGQPHTYFVSKLPRKSDRDRIQEAFGLGDEALDETFRFKPGQWLLISHDATGMEGIPVPIKMENANERILDFLQKFNGNT